MMSLGGQINWYNMTGMLKKETPGRGCPIENYEDGTARHRHEKNNCGLMLEGIHVCREAASNLQFTEQIRVICSMEKTPLLRLPAIATIQGNR